MHSAISGILRRTSRTWVDAGWMTSQPQNGKRIDRMGMWFVGWNFVAAISNPPRGFDEPQPTWALD